MISSPEAPLLEEVKIEKDIESLLCSPENMLSLFNQLIEQGHSPRLVFAVLNNLNVYDIQTANTALIKTKKGWQHRFLKNTNNKCLICNENYKSHVESKKKVNMNIINALARKTTNDNIDKWRTSIQCKICFEDIPLNHEFHLPCGHVHCRNCVKDFLELKVGNRTILDLKCPKEGCEVKFGKEEIKRLTNPGIYQKYLDFKLDHDISMNNKMRWCPSKSCGRYVTNSKGKSRVSCDCGTEMCFRCGEVWHQGSCDENSDKLYKNWAIDKLVQRCPKCKIRIEKNKGCSHMTCSNCNYEWCWICGLPYNERHLHSIFFSCMILEFAPDINGVSGIILINLIAFILSPVLSLIKAFLIAVMISVELYEDYIEEKPFCIRVWYIIFSILASIIVIVVLGGVMIVPVFGFRLYCLFYAFIRACRT